MSWPWSGSWGVRFPAGHPVLAWVVEAVGDLATKHLRGSDGRAGYERLFGKAPREEGLELGEMVLWRRPKHAGANVLLEARWENWSLAGAGLGRYYAPDRRGACGRGDEGRAAEA